MPSAHAETDGPRNGSTNIALWSAGSNLLTGQALVTRRVRERQSKLHWHDHVYRGAGLRSMASWVSAVVRLWKGIASGQMDRIYLVCSRSNGGFIRDIPALLGARAGIRVIVHAHGSDIVDLLSGRRLSPLARRLYSRCEIIVPSRHLLEPLEMVTRRPARLCENYNSGNAVDAQAGRGDATKLTVCWNSNIMASKGFFDLAEGVRTFREEGGPVGLVSMGQPMADEEMSEDEATERLAALCSHGWIDHRGRVDPGIAGVIVAQADVVALPSRYSSECQPLAIIQAMCAGKAIIVADTPALRATLQDYPAHFVPAHSVAAMADALRTLWHHKSTDAAAFVAQRSEAAAAARARFSPDRFDREMEAFLSAA